jgi:hypothetical protein
MHNVDAFFKNLDDLIDYMVNQDEINDNIDNAALTKADVCKEDILLAYIPASEKTNTHPGYIWRVLASSGIPCSNKKRLQVNIAQNTTVTLPNGDLK